MRTTIRPSVGISGRARTSSMRIRSPDSSTPFGRRRFEETPRPEGYVPDTELWWVAGDEFLGRIGIRHRLTPMLLEMGGHIGYDVRPSARRRGHATEMLRHGLMVARDLGIDPALITCDIDNAGFARGHRAERRRPGGRTQRQAALLGAHTTVRRSWRCSPTTPVHDPAVEGPRREPDLLSRRARPRDPARGPRRGRRGADRVQDRERPADPLEEHRRHLGHPDADGLDRAGHPRGARGPALPRREDRGVRSAVSGHDDGIADLGYSWAAWFIDPSENCLAVVQPKD